MSMPVVIGLCGGKWNDGGVGKSTVANILAKQLGFFPVSLVDPVKDVAKEFFGWDGKMDDATRILLDRICRIGRSISEGYWLDLTVSKIPKDGSVRRVVFDDVWFPNEARWIAGCGGIMFAVTRPGHEMPVMPCETVELPNGGTLAELYGRIPLIVEASLSERGLS